MDQKKHIRNKTCDYCPVPRSFSKVSELKFHLLQTHYNDGNRCSFCNEIFVKSVNKDTILKHMQRHHGQQRKPKKLEMKKKHIRNKTCDYCVTKPTFRTIAILKNHLYLQHQDEGRKCVICGEIFLKTVPYDTLRKHYERNHKNFSGYKNILSSQYVKS